MHKSTKIYIYPPNEATNDIYLSYQQTFYLHCLFLFNYCVVSCEWNVDIKLKILLFAFHKWNSFNKLPRLNENKKIKSFRFCQSKNFAINIGAGWRKCGSLFICASTRKCTQKYRTYNYFLLFRLIGESFCKLDLLIFLGKVVIYHHVYVNL